jgi:hypothetical protein
MCSTGAPPECASGRWEREREAEASDGRGVEQVEGGGAGEQGSEALEKFVGGELLLHSGEEMRVRRRAGILFFYFFLNKKEEKRDR